MPTQTHKNKRFQTSLGDLMRRVGALEAGHVVEEVQEPDIEWMAVLEVPEGMRGQIQAAQRDPKDATRIAFKSFAETQYAEIRHQHPERTEEFDMAIKRAREALA